jgi:hypothetical protein
MKNFCIIPVLIFLLLMLAYQCGHAQDYVVTVKRDTLRGTVKQLTFSPEKKVQIISADKKKTIISITQLLSFTDKGEIFHPVRNDKGYVFMKLLKSGYLSLYAFQMENQVTYDGLYLVKKDGKRVEIPNLSFKKIITRFLEDCPYVSSRVDSGDLGKREINLIIDEYNKCIDSRTTENSVVEVAPVKTTKKLGAWDTLEEKVKAEPEFEGKKDALDMISEIKNKLSKSEKVPNFMLEGLKSTLAQRNLTAELENALKENN